tara:strand:+ start:332 stop:517 length:186 start_codon:yes stop_codon:yes gene_type:complete
MLMPNTPNKKKSEVLEMKGLTILKTRNSCKKFFLSLKTKILRMPAVNMTMTSLIKKLIISG